MALHAALPVNAYTESERGDHQKATAYNDLEQSVTELDKEAAAIRVLAATIRALPAAGKRKLSVTSSIIIMLVAILANNAAWALLMLYR
jgi:hypothetical protein